MRQIVPVLFAAALLGGCAESHDRIEGEPEIDAGIRAPVDARIVPDSNLLEPDAGQSDAGLVCPSDFVAAIGMPCAISGATCGGPCDPCGFCNLLMCESGVWTRLEAPPPPGPCRSFACGPDLRCNMESQYCERGISDIGGIPDDYQCRSLDPGCASCACTPEPSACVQDSEGGMTITYGGG
jgi:hypothetical protein